MKNQSFSPGNSKAEDGVDVQIDGNEEGNVDSNNSLDKDCSEDGDLQRDGDKDLGQDGYDNADIDADGNEGFEGGGNGDKNINDSGNKKVNVNVDINIGDGGNDEIELDDDLGQDRGMHRHINFGSNIGIDFNNKGNNRDLDGGDNTKNVDDGAGLERRDLAGLSKAGNRHGDLADCHRADDSKVSTNGKRSGSSHSEDAEGKDSREDGTETHCCLG